MDKPTIDHRGQEFAALGKRVFAGLQRVFKCTGPTFIYSASGTGAWEAALVNCLTPGDQVLMYETGQFSTLWKDLTQRMGYKPDVIPGDWRSGVDVDKIAERLRQDSAHVIKAVCVVHNETSTGCTSPVAKVRKALDDARHPALLMVDAVSSLASIDYRHDEWKVDVTIAASQKGMMLPPGLAFIAASKKAIETSKSNTAPRAFWSWEEMMKFNADGFFPSTPATNLLYGLSEAIDMLEEEGLDNVFTRHARHAEATRRAVGAWDLETVCNQPAHYSNSVTAIQMPQGYSADAFRKLVLEKFNMSLGNGLNKLADKVFRIGHMGDFNDLMLLGALSGVEMGLELANVPHRPGGVQAALDYLKGNR